MTEPTDKEVLRSMDIPADPGEVWLAITERDLLGTWMGGDIDIDPRTGGSITFDDGAEIRRGSIDTFVERERISFIWYVDEEDPTEVSFELEPLEDGTRLTVTERPFRWEFEIIDPSWTAGAGGTWLVAGVR